MLNDDIYIYSYTVGTMWWVWGPREIWAGDAYEYGGPEKSELATYRMHGHRDILAIDAYWMSMGAQRRLS